MKDTKSEKGNTNQPGQSTPKAVRSSKPLKDKVKRRATKTVMKK